MTFGVFTLPVTRKSIVSKRHFLWAQPIYLKNDITCGQWLDNQRYILIQIYLGTWTFFYLSLIHARQQFRRGRSRSWDVRIYRVYLMSLRDPALNAWQDRFLCNISLEMWRARVSSCSLWDDRTPRFHDPFSSLFSSYVIYVKKKHELKSHAIWCFSITSFFSWVFFFRKTGTFHLKAIEVWW